MTKEQIASEVQEIFRQVFGDEALQLTPQTSQDDIVEWDSLEQINILSIIEQKFEIKFDLSEVVNIKTAGDIVETAASKVNL